ncbi:restriction endonuclease [Streptomyces microflavus]|uniref:restriction endonuclease n=1 Tax=Streptomyces microflavus TaxID=1919 RepID=UPI003800DF36
MGFGVPVVRPPPAAPGAPLVLNGPSAHTEVLATDPLGRTWVIQAEHRKDGDRGSAVSSPDLQRVNGTARQLYGADIVLVVTNGRFTTHCLPLVQQLHMHLADRRTLATWASDGRPLSHRPGNRADPSWASQVRSSLAGDLAIGFGATIPLNAETEWDEVKRTWAVEKHDRPARDRYGVGAERINGINEDRLRIIWTLLGTLLLIRQPAAPCGRPSRYGPTLPSSNACAGPVPSAPPPRSATSRSASPSGRPPTTTVMPGTPTDVSTATNSSYAPPPHLPEGYSRKRVGPYLVTPEGCEDAPILGGERVVGVLRR